MMTDPAADDEVETQIPAISADTLLTKCHELLDELEQFQAFLVQEKKEHTVQLRQFRNSVISELKSLEKVVYVQDSGGVKHIPNVFCSSLKQTQPRNVPFTLCDLRTYRSIAQFGQLQSLVEDLCSSTNASTGTRSWAGLSMVVRSRGENGLHSWI